MRPTNTSQRGAGVSMNFNLDKRCAMVTGASGQLGCGMVNGLLACGANVLASDVSLSDLTAASQQFRWPSEKVALASVDVRSRQDITNALSAAKEVFGGVDMLVNNAGVSVFEPFLDRPESSIDWVMDVNLKGTILCIQEFVKSRIQAGGGGTVVNIGSHYGVISPDPRIYTDCLRKNSEIYGASKAGVIQMTRYFAVHLAPHDIRVNSVSPGGIINPIEPQGVDFQEKYGFRCPTGRMADTSEIVAPVIFLLSPLSSYVNGHNLIVDGGMTSW
jgi:NAD(P)-dependent dehydrogenase (short-subunit alcohol dehydrogenase family)